MAYFANRRLQDTQVGVTTYFFVSIQKIPTYDGGVYVAPGPDFGVRYWFNYKKGNPGYHKDLFVKSFTPVIHRDTLAGTLTAGANPSHKIYHYVVQQGMDCDYLDMYNEATHQTNNIFPYLIANPSSSGPFDPTNYKLVLPGYVYSFAGGAAANTFTASTDLSFWLGNPTYTVTAGTSTRTYSVATDVNKTPAISINGFYFLVTACTGFGGNNWMTSNGLLPLNTAASTIDANLHGLTGVTFTNAGVTVNTVQGGPTAAGWTATSYSVSNQARLYGINPVAFPYPTPATSGYITNTIQSFYSQVTVKGVSALTAGPYSTQKSGTTPVSLNMALTDQTGSVAAVITAGLDQLGYERRFPITARLTPQYRYVTHCAGRGTCNTDTGLCECFSGYKTAVCDTQAPQC